MEVLFLLFWGPLAATLVLTLLMGRLSRHRWLMRLPLGFLLIPLAGGVYEWRQGGFFWELGVLLWAMIGGAISLGWLVGWRLCRGKERAP